MLVAARNSCCSCSRLLSLKEVCHGVLRVFVLPRCSRTFAARVKLPGPSYMYVPVVIEKWFVLTVMFYVPRREPRLRVCMCTFWRLVHAVGKSVTCVYMHVVEHVIRYSERYASSRLCGTLRSRVSFCFACRGWAIFLDGVAVRCFLHQALSLHQRVSRWFYRVRCLRCVFHVWRCL